MHALSECLLEYCVRLPHRMFFLEYFLIINIGQLLIATDKSFAHPPLNGPVPGSQTVPLWITSLLCLRQMRNRHFIPVSKALSEVVLCNVYIHSRMNTDRRQKIALKYKLCLLDGHKSHHLHWKQHLKVRQFGVS